MIEEIDQEGKELERMHKSLIHKREEKQRNEDAENYKANEEVMMIIEKMFQLVFDVVFCIFILSENNNSKFIPAFFVWTLVILNPFK